MTTDRHSIAPYPLRLQPELRDRLEAAAAQEGRSLHAEIIARLEKSFAEDSGTQVVAALAYRLAVLEYQLLERNKDVADISNLGKHVVDRFTSSKAPSKKEIDEWNEAFSYLVGTWNSEAIKAAVDSKYSAIKEAQFRLHGLTKTRQYDLQAGDIAQTLSNAALDRLPPASEVYSQTEKEAEIEATLLKPSKAPAKRILRKPRLKKDK